MPLWIPPTSVSIRTRATSNFTLYVATTGNDANDGLTVGTPKLTIQAAYNLLVSSYDLAGFTPTIRIADGTYSSQNVICSGRLVGQSLDVNFVGNTVTPSNVILSSGSLQCFEIMDTRVSVSGMTLTGLVGILAYFFGRITFTDIIFGACSSAHISCSGGVCIAQGPYSVHGAAPYHVLSDSTGSKAILSLRTLTFINAQNYSSAFAVATAGGLIQISGCTFTNSGIVTGTRYIVNENSVIETGSGASATYLPGNSAGSSATGGQYT